MTLRLLSDQPTRSRELSGVSIVLARENRPPFAIDVHAVEDDTYLVLGADPAYRAPREHALRVLTAAHEAEPRLPGSVVVAGGQPLKMHAIVHDLSRDPTWTEKWVASALRNLLAAVEDRGLRALATPRLGGVHGALPPERFVHLLDRALAAVGPSSLRRIWLVEPTPRSGSAR